jgi:hypothetical protein
LCPESTSCCSRHYSGKTRAASGFCSPTHVFPRIPASPVIIVNCLRLPCTRDALSKITITARKGRGESGDVEFSRSWMCQSTSIYGGTAGLPIGLQASGFSFMGLDATRPVSAPASSGTVQRGLFNTIPLLLSFSWGRCASVLVLSTTTGSMPCVCYFQASAWSCVQCVCLYHILSSLWDFSPAECSTSHSSLNVDHPSQTAL